MQPAAETRAVVPKQAATAKGWISRLLSVVSPGSGSRASEVEPEAFDPTEEAAKGLAVARAALASPYADLPSRAFWRSGVGEQDLPRIADLYRKRFDLRPEDKIATAGSCFAQHIARRLSAAGFAVLDKEPAPPGFTAEDASRFGYGLYSARYGNIYTARQLLQLASEAFGMFAPSDAVWRCGDRFFDALRPGVEPVGLSSADEVRAHRTMHLERVRKAFSQADVIIFTFGLTETWAHRESGTVYPTAPGTIAGDYDPDRFAFLNLTHGDTLGDFMAFRELVRDVNPNVRFLLTVSPVPLTATASGDHVLAATIYSKSVLRAVAGELRDRFDDVDYFPSYEIVAGHPSAGKLFEPNLRSVSPAGVDIVMRAFFEAHGLSEAQPPAPRKKSERKPSKDQLVCEEKILDAFAK